MPRIPFPIRQGWQQLLAAMRVHPPRASRRRLLDSLQHQRLLLRSGMESIADVIDIEVHGRVIHELVNVRLLVGVYAPGRSRHELIRTTSVIHRERVPRPGDRIMIRYMPGDTSAVLIL